MNERCTILSMPRYLLLSVTAIFCACGSHSSDYEDLNTRTVTLPDGAAIRAEVKSTPEAMAQGMMYRNSIAPDRGMLFVHGTAGVYPYWMHDCKIALDIIWMNSDHKVVEIAADAPPCQSKPEDCPTFGGHERAQYVLEMGAGQAKKHRIETGTTIAF